MISKKKSIWNLWFAFLNNYEFILLNAKVMKGNNKGTENVIVEAVNVEILEPENKKN